jgi:DNA polymerase-3 subunit alpha
LKVKFYSTSKKIQYKTCCGVDFRNGNSQQFFAIVKSITDFENIILYLSAFFEFKKVIPDRPKFL